MLPRVSNSSLWMIPFNPALRTPDLPDRPFLKFFMICLTFPRSISAPLQQKEGQIPHYYFFMTFVGKGMCSFIPQ